MTYKPGSCLIGEDFLTIFITDRITLVFRGLSKPCIKGLRNSKIEYMEFAQGEVKVEDVPPMTPPPVPTR